MSDNDEEFTVPPETRRESVGLEDKESERRPRLGVLLVHGIGEQKRGETVPWAGDPLFKWLRSWVSRNQDKGYASDGSTGGAFADSYPHRVYLADTRLTHTIPSEVDAPPFTRVWFQERESGPSEENDPHWIMAESHWAAEFVTPSYNQVLQWGLGVAPVIIEQTGLRIIGETFKLISERQQDIERRRTEGIISKIGVGVSKGLTVISQALTWLIGRLILLVLGLVAQLLILAVMVLGFIPPLQGLVVKLQAALAGEFGDAYLAAANEVEFDSMVSQVRRDIKWLAGEGETQGRCQAVAVIAHSGGTEVAYRALAGPHTPDAPVCTTDNPLLLVTYGNDQSKINTLRHLLQRKGVLTGLTIARLVALIPLWFALVGLMQGQITSDEQTLLVSLAAFGIVVEILLWIGGGLLIRGTRKEKPFRPAIPDGVAWIDYRAPMDIVPDGDIVATPHAGERAERTEPVSNLHSPIQDHGWYWHNAEEYVPDVARLLFAQAEGRDLAINGDPQGIETLKVAAHKRRNRVHRYLGLGLAVILSMPALWVCAWPWIFYAGEFVRKLIVDLVSSLSGGSLDFNAPAGFQTHFWAILIGMALSSVAVGLLYQLLPFQLFSAWSRNDKDAMFRRYQDREGKDGEGEKDSRLPSILFLATSALIPIVLFVYLVWIIIDPNSTIRSLETFKMWDAPAGLILLWALPILQFFVASVNAFYTVWTWKEMSRKPGERPRVAFDEVFARLVETWASRHPDAAVSLTPPES